MKLGFARMKPDFVLIMVFFNFSELKNEFEIRRGATPKLAQRLHFFIREAASFATEGSSFIFSLTGSKKREAEPKHI